MSRPAGFTAIHTEGGLLPADFLSRVGVGDSSVPGMSEASYHMAPSEWLGEQIAHSWRRLTHAWARFAAELLDSQGELPAGVTREHWLLPLFQELGYGRLQTTRAIERVGKAYPVSHLWGPVPIHLVGTGTSLDRRQAGVRGAATASPHSMIQELLNRSPEHLWGIVSNGLRLRLLRDNASLTRQAYLEFDLETIFADEVYDEFIVLWLTCHESRLEGADPAACLLEQWTAEAAEAGTRAFAALRGQVEQAITCLGRGFLAFPGNHLLRKRIREGDLARDDYYRQLLRLVYRLIFLFVAEDRGLLHDPAAPELARRRYADHYSAARLRATAAGRSSRGPYSDLWCSLTVAMRGLSHPDGCPQLGLPALGSFLWSSETIPDLDAAEISDTELLAAIRALTLIDDKQARLTRAVDYRNLGADELGGVYEGLLELLPDLDAEAGHFELSAGSGSERRTTGSYYTPEPIIAAILDLALAPILDEAVKAPDPERAILGLKVLDPAAGSGHFLTAAAHRIAKRLAAIRTGDPEPSPNAVRIALHDTVGHCVYGIDRNPMAVELCKVSLWMQGTDPGHPLSFLDSHIVCGDALLGALPGQLAEPIPDSAYTAVFDDSKTTVSALRKRNRSERGGQGRLSLGPDTTGASMLAAFDELERIDDSTLAGVREKERTYARLKGSAEAHTQVTAADAWCAAFMAPKRSGDPGITQATVAGATTNPDDGDDLRFAEEIAARYRLLHPHLAFPAILRTGTGRTDSRTGWSGGFDLVLGNPPWDTLSPDRKEFFAAYEPAIRFANKADQDEIAAELLQFPEIAQKWDDYQRDLYAAVHYMKNSGRYRLFAPGNLGKGDFNVYRMFVEAALQLTRPGGYAAQVMPAGFYGGANAMAIRKELFEHWTLTHVLGFINTGEHWFNSVDATTRFCLYAARKGDNTREFDVAFAVRSTTDLATALAGGTTPFTVAEVRAQSPEALAIPEVADPEDAARAARMSRRWPPFGDKKAGPPIRNYQREIDMGTDRDLFGDYQEGLPLYEGRMVGQFDHRAKAYRSGRGRAAVWEKLPFGHLGKAIVPQWRVPEQNIPAKVGDRSHRYRVGWNDVTAPRNERSLVAALIPPGVICGHKVPTFVFPSEYEWAYMLWLAVANSFCVDYLARKKVALSMSITALDSLPFPRLAVDDPAAIRLGRLALHLTCTSLEMTGYWNAMARHGWCQPVPENSEPSGLINTDKRELARAEIDAIVARELFGLERDELGAILDTFPVLVRRERKTWKEYRSKRLILERFDALVEVGNVFDLPSVLDAGGASTLRP